jgi:hypothetical protein
MRRIPLILKVWLGGLDSNQDSQLQRLMYYRLYDLPVVEEEGVTVLAPRRLRQAHDRRTSEIVNDEASIPAIVLSINLFKLLKIAGIAGFC